MKSWLTPEKILRLFFYRSDVFALQQESGAYFPVKRPINIFDIIDHLEGRITVGAYCIGLDNKVKWCCVDIDGEETEEDLKRMRYTGSIIYDLFPDFMRMLEFSGRRGYHIWIFFKEPTNATLAKSIVKARLNKAGLNRFEVYPKQTELNEGRKYGNLVKIPLAKHRVSGKRSEIIKYDKELESL